MRSERYLSPRILFAVLLGLIGGTSAFAQNGKLNLHVSPKQAYVFVDDRAISEASFVGCVRGVLVCIVEQPETMVIFRRRGPAFVTRDMSEKQFLAALERHGMKCEGFMGYVNLGILGHRPVSIGTRLGQAPT